MMKEFVLQKSLLGWNLPVSATPPTGGCSSCYEPTASHPRSVTQSLSAAPLATFTTFTTFTPACFGCRSSSRGCGPYQARSVCPIFGEIFLLLAGEKALALVLERCALFRVAVVLICSLSIYGECRNLFLATIYSESPRCS